MQAFDDLPDHLANIDGHGIKPELVRVDTRHIQQDGGTLHVAGNKPLDLRETVVQHFQLEPRPGDHVAQHAHAADDWHHWIAQFVRDHGEESVARGDRLDESGAFLLQLRNSTLQTQAAVGRRGSLIGLGGIDGIGGTWFAQEDSSWGAWITVTKLL